MIIILLVALLPVALADDDPGWSKEVVVRQGVDPVVRIQARIVSGYLIVRARHERGWHTYAMDNELRAAAALAGKKSLGIEQGIDIRVERGLELDNRWLQTEPGDLSQPEIRWFTYGFDETALFACRVKEVTSDQVVLRLRGQACSGETCCQVDVALKLTTIRPPADEPPRSSADQVQEMLKGLVPVEKQNDAATPQDPKS